MHLYLATRGINQNVELWKMFMQTQMFDWKRKNLITGKEEISRVQGALRPIQLWEYVFPEESLPEVLTMLHKTDAEKTNYFGNGFAKYGAPFLRSALGAEKAPNIKPVPTNRFIFTDSVATEVIGIKKDKRVEWKEIGYEQEML